MISSSSARVFIVLNGALVVVSYAYYYISQTNFLLRLLFTIFRNVLMIKTFDYALSDKLPINKNYIHPEGEFTYYILQASFLESATTYCVTPLNVTPNSLIVAAAFLPMSFAFEIIFDFFFYWSHRLLHTAHIPWHKDHHTYIHLKPVLAFYHNWLDIILTISLPFILTGKIVQAVYPLSAFEISLLTTYKIFVEIAGHTGRVSEPASSFTQFIWLPKLLNIELYTEDHNLHHTDPEFNFAKRFSLWDKAFGTYKSAVEKRALTNA